MPHQSSAVELGELHRLRNLKSCIQRRLRPPLASKLASISPLLHFSTLAAGSSPAPRSRPGRIVLPKIAGASLDSKQLERGENQGNEDSASGRRERLPEGKQETGRDSSATLQQAAVQSHIKQDSRAHSESDPVQKTELVRPSRFWRFGSLPSRINPTAPAEEGTTSST